MREIKFRAKAGLRWCYGEFYHSERNEPVIYEPQSRGKTLEGIPYDGWRLKVDPETVGQYTGLKDCEGREIYEGDLVRIDDWSIPSYIRWDDATASFVVDRWSVNLAHVSQIKVIGNVHDNPDLLEKRP